MKRIFGLVCAIILMAPWSLSAIKADEETGGSCAGVNRIEINDPAELKGEPNDIKRVTLEVFRSRNSEGKQVRKIEMTMEVHSRYFAKPPEIVAIMFTIKMTDTTGKVGVVQDALGVQYMPGIAIFDYDERQLNYSMIEDIETSNQIKLTCANIQFVMGTFNTETETFTETDSTEWSPDQVDLANTTQPPNPTELKAENDMGCVKLSWAKAPKSVVNMETTEYRVYRDGNLIGTVPASAPTFKDCDVKAGGIYKYAVCGVSPWLVESPKTPLSFTYNPQAKIIPEKDTIDFGYNEVSKMKPVKIKVSNYGDLDADVKLEQSDDWFKLNPTSLKIDKGKRTDLEVSIDPAKVKPGQSYEGSIKVTWGTTDFQMISVLARIKPDSTPPEFKVDDFVEVTNQATYTVTGTTEPDATISVNGVKATVDSEGKFSAVINIIGAPSTTNVEIKATDPTGNTIKKVVGKIVNILNSKVILVIGSEKMDVNGKSVEIKPAPQIIGGKTLVPLRAVADAFGATVNWDGDTKTATISLSGKTIQITLDKEIAIVNGEAKAIGSKAILLGGRVMVPFRFIAEALGATVDFNGETKTITLTLVIKP